MAQRILRIAFQIEYYLEQKGNPVKSTLDSLGTMQWTTIDVIEFPYFFVDTMASVKCLVFHMKELKTISRRKDDITNKYKA